MDEINDALDADMVIILGANDIVTARRRPE